MLISRKPTLAKLRAVVETFWCVHDTTATGYETLLPTARAQLLISLSSRPVAELKSADSSSGNDMLQVVQGPTTRPHRVPRRPQAALCGISFCPGAASIFFGPLHQVTDQIICLSRFWGGSDASRLGDLLRGQWTQEVVLNLLETEMAGRIGDISVQLLLGRILDYMATGASLGDVAEAFGLSDHTFRALFQNHVGMTPKRFLRVERFRATINRLQPTTHLADLAYEQDFSDQAHMAREISHFATLTPGQLRERHRPYAGHLPDAKR